MGKQRFAATLAAVLVLTWTGPGLAAPIRKIVLVHGAFADGSGWKAVADILVTAGYKVSVAQHPSWYIVATDDRIINPELQRHMARRAGSKTTDIKGSHAVFISQPAAVARVIVDAAQADSRKTP